MRWRGWSTRQQTISQQVIRRLTNYLEVLGGSNFGVQSDNYPDWHNSIALVVLWDEEVYSVAPNIIKVLFIFDTNYGTHGVQSSTAYNHFSLLKSLEGALGLPCLNHACDGTMKVM